MEATIHDGVLANGVRLRVLEWNPGGARTILCLHGYLDFARGWELVTPRLAAAGYHVLAPDLRGHGDSEHIGASANYYFFDYVFDIADVVAHLARPRLCLAGHSMGGLVASYFAGAFPERVERLALLEGVGWRDEPLADAPECTASWIAEVRYARAQRPRVYPDLDAVAARFVSVDAKCPPDVARFLARHGARAAHGGFVLKHDPVLLTRGALPFQIATARAYWKAIRCPTLLLDGAESTFIRQIPDLAERYACFADARRVTIAGAGHMMIRHRPDAVAEALLQFFD